MVKSHFLASWGILGCPHSSLGFLKFNSKLLEWGYSWKKKSSWSPFIFCIHSLCFFFCPFKGNFDLNMKPRYFFCILTTWYLLEQVFGDNNSPSFLFFSLSLIFITMPSRYLSCSTTHHTHQEKMPLFPSWTHIHH